MSASSWVLQIFQMSDEAVQGMVGGLLSGVEGLTVELAASGPDRFLIVDCRRKDQAVAVHRFVTAVDPNAVVIHTTAPSASNPELIDA